jgi:hypothetical protein
MIRLRDEAIVQKLHLLMDYYKIQNKEDWFALARALALAHVDGLKRATFDQLHGFGIAASDESSAVEHFSGAVRLNKKHSGRPTLWPHDRLLALHAAVETGASEDAVRPDGSPLQAGRLDSDRPAAVSTTTKPGQLREERGG